MSPLRAESILLVLWDALMEAFKAKCLRRGGVGWGVGGRGVGAGLPSAVPLD